MKTQLQIRDHRLIFAAVETNILRHHPVAALRSASPVGRGSCSAQISGLRGSVALPRWSANLILVLALALAGNVPAQVNSGSDGRDGALNPATSTVIDLADTRMASTNTLPSIFQPT